MQAVEGRITKDMNPIHSACLMDTDEIVRFGEMRKRLEAAIEMCYQSTGYRRVKNPRIWSMHDLALLTEKR